MLFLSENLKKYRILKNLTQEDVAGYLGITSQSVSKWERGETVPNTETLKLLSKEFDVSINTLLGEPRKLVCQDYEQWSNCQNNCA